VVVAPHLIPAGTLANHDIDRAMEEPLALGRDEVLYMVCTHPRLRTVWQRPEEREFPVLIARHAGASDIGWDPEPWAVVAVPEHVCRSNLEYLIIDPALESVEGLAPAGFDPEGDPDGKAGGHHQELLAWIFDRHLEATEPRKEVHRGSVEGGELSFQLEYIGKSDFDALRRAAGPHHKLPYLLHRTNFYTPHLLTYVFACEVRLVVYEVGEVGKAKTLRFADALREYELPRDAIVPAAEEMLISRLGAHHNKRSTGKRGVRICGKNEAVVHDSHQVGWKLRPDG
jgi:hypothetical protein